MTMTGHQKLTGHDRTTLGYTPDNPVEDPLKWFDEGLPDLFGQCI